MPVKICKHGNSLSIRLGAHITRLSHLKAGDYVSVRLLDNGDIRVRPVGLVIPAERGDCASDSVQIPSVPKVTIW
jgi:antitoxin component of MazEF toxin-antitoxin module